MPAMSPSGWVIRAGSGKRIENRSNVDLMGNIEGIELEEKIMSQTEIEQPKAESSGFHKFAWIRIVAGVLIAIGLVWGISYLLNMYGSGDQTRPSTSGSSHSAAAEPAGEAGGHTAEPSAAVPSHGQAASHETPAPSLSAWGGGGK